MGKTERGKGSKLMAVGGRAGLPVAIYMMPVGPHEVSLAEDTVTSRFTDAQPERLIGDKAFDTDGLDQVLAEQGIEMIGPHRSNRKMKTRDGRYLRRSRRRWKVERLIAWPHNFRRLVVRYERHLHNYLGFVHLACTATLLRSYL